ncbi:sensor histidine kinase [Anaeromonas frigoriresistens]
MNFNLDNLPSTNHLLEQEYQNVIENFYQDKLNMTSKFDKDKSDLIDYFTLWAHQIKTPIAAMDLLLQSGENIDSDELSLELFKIEEYVEMVLQYLRLDSESSDLVLKYHNLDNIIKQAIRKYAKVFIRKKIKLEYLESNCEVLTDEKWLLFVIEQILSNSLKYTNKGEISIYMERDHKKVLVIEDTGIGIAPEDLPRVFEKGFTGYNGRIDKKSTGIGLYLCKRILTKLSHSITIESQVSKGTKVKIDLDTIDIRLE